MKKDSAHCRDLIRQIYTAAHRWTSPPQGWLRTTRTALHMTGAQLARRTHVTRAHISNTEHAELTGHLTLKTLHSLAHAMDCRLVYAIVPNHPIDDLIAAQARKPATRVLLSLNEDLSEKSRSFPAELRAKIERLTQIIIEDPSISFWDH